MNEVEGRMRFNIDVQLTTDEMKTWSPDKIAQFFNGIAKTVRARGEAETAPVKYSARRTGLAPMR